jgi:hypothetical protein
LERSSFSNNAGHRSALTPELLGRIIAYAWQVAGARNSGDMHDGDMFSFLLSSQNPPENISRLLHVENRVDGSYLEERTRLVVGAQSAEVIGRLNPSHVPPVFKGDTVQANFVLSQYESEFPQEVAWIKSAVSEASQ